MFKRTLFAVGALFEPDFGLLIKSDVRRGFDEHLRGIDAELFQLLGGCSFETFTNNEFLEIETLGPLIKLPPGKTAEQVEHWSLHRGVNLTALTDDAIDAAILPLLREGASTN